MDATTIDALAIARIGRDAFQRIEKNAGRAAAVRAAVARMLADQHQERAAWGVPPAPPPGAEPMPVTEPVALDDARDRVAFLESLVQERDATIANLETSLERSRAMIDAMQSELDEVDRKIKRTLEPYVRADSIARSQEIHDAIARTTAERDSAREALERVSAQLANAVARLLEVGT